MKVTECEICEDYWGFAQMQQRSWSLQEEEKRFYGGQHRKLSSGSKEGLARCFSEISWECRKQSITSHS